MNNMDDINVAYRIRHALNENLDALPASTTERLATARTRALARKKADAPLARRAHRPAFSLHAMLSMDGLGRVAIAAPLLAAVFGLAGMYQVEQQHRIAELAELDAAVLSDELPLTAYLDHGFNAYVAAQPQSQTEPRTAQ
jgi:hypothetical protein